MNNKFHNQSELSRFYELASHGQQRGALSREKAVWKLAKAIMETMPFLDDEAIQGAQALIDVCKLASGRTKKTRNKEADRPQFVEECPNPETLVEGFMRLAKKLAAMRRRVEIVELEIGMRLPIEDDDDSQ